MLDPKEINRLLLRIAKEDEKALEELYDKTYGLMVSIAVKELKEKSCANDVVSEAYVKIYQKIKQFDGKRNGIDWIYQIVKNQARDYYRWYIKQTEEYDDTSYVIKTNVSVEQRKNLGVALRILTEEEYRIVYLRMWERWTLKDIAREYKYSISMAYRIYDNALRKMREFLE